ncbi:MAG: glutathione S-transferase C-terminal domain-containing protein [Gammaproteobacteria bacterium]
MLQAGRWKDEDQVVERGAFVRQPSVYRGTIGSDIIEAIAAEPRRFWLIASASCPWSHRTLLVRSLKGLSRSIPVHIAHGPRVEGYAVDGGARWAVPGTAQTIVHLHELYALGDSSYTGRSTVPVLWDSKRRRIVSNESAAIMRAFDAVRAPDAGLDFTLVPDRLSSRIDALNAGIYDGLSNAVYRAGFAQAQDAYDAAVQRVFATLDDLEKRLSSRRYLLGETITEADWRLFPTLFRFDAIYYVLHRCTQDRLVDFPQLWPYARDLYAWRGIADVVSLEAMRVAGYASDAGNPHGIVAVAPRADWRAPHGRDALGPARVTLRSGEEIEVDPTAFGRSEG